MNKDDARNRIVSFLESHMYLLNTGSEIVSDINAIIKYDLFPTEDNRFDYDRFNQFTCTEFDDGTFYLGKVENGKRNGWGCQYYSDGRLYMGHWHNDYRHGEGILLTQKICYDGEFNMDKFHGSGQLAWHNFWTRADFENGEIKKAYYPTSGFTYNGKHFDKDGNSGCAGIVLIAIIMSVVGLLAL